MSCIFRSIFVISMCVLYSSVIYGKSQFTLPPTIKNIEEYHISEIYLWNATNDCSSIKCYEIYIDKYPKGEFIEIAKERIRIEKNKGEIINSLLGSKKDIILKKENLKKPKWCEKMSRKSEIIICSSEKLWVLDKINIELYESIYNKYKESKKNINELHSWINYKNKKCNSVESCIIIYENRINVLKERKSINRNEYKNKEGSKKPSWCNNILNESEYFICKNSIIWKFENRLTSLYEKTTEKDRGILKMFEWQQNERKEKCKEIISECLQNYHEKMYQIYYLLN